MSAPLGASTRVLVATAADGVEATVRDAIEGDEGPDEVTRVTSLGSLRDAIAEYDDVGCVVVHDDLAVPAACATVADADPDLPVVVLASDGSEALAERATRAGAAAYVPDEERAALAEHVATAVERYDDRRWDRARASAFDTLLEATDRAVYVKDEQARHLLKSTTAGDLRPEAFVGRTDEEVYGDAEGYREDLSVIEDDERVEGDVRQYQVGNETRWAKTTKVPWRENGEVRGLVGFTEDVTETVRRRQRLHSHRERREELTSYLRHDLRNPLQVASSALELAQETGDETAFEKARNALARMEEILEDLSALAEDDLETGDDDGAVPSGTAFAQVTRDVWEALETNGATLNVKFPDESRIIAPGAGVRPVLENLFKNALEHGGPGVTIVVGPLADGFYVADSGHGIPPEERDNVFESGYTTGEDGGGTGLTIVSDIAERQGWTVALTESVSGGARFEFHNCPLVRSPDGAAEPTGTVPFADRVDSTDVGAVAVSGNTEREDGHWVVTGAGRNVHRRINEFQFGSVPANGPVRITARIEDLNRVTEWTTAGLMIRGGRGEDAPYAAVGQTDDHGTAVLWRPQRGADGVGQAFEEAPFALPWYRLERTGGRMSAFASTDGEQWRPLDQRPVSTSDPVRVGLFVCSNLPGKTASALFTDLTVETLTSE
ncbi:MAG: ATP-binding protein [Haloarculaceae archaeon]